MTFLVALWLPILLSAVLVFLAAFAMWVVLPHHRTDFRPLPDEEALMGTLRSQGVEPGMYSFPWQEREEGHTESYLEKVRQGPVGILLVARPETRLTMTPALVQSFVYYVVIGTFVAYLGWHALGPGAPYLQVFQVVGTGAILAHAGAILPKAIFFSFSWSSAWKEVLDGVVYGLLTAGVFGWLWPM